MARSETFKSPRLTTWLVALLALCTVLAYQTLADESAGPSEETSNAWFSLPPDVIAHLADDEAPSVDLEITHLPGGAFMIDPEGVHPNGPAICLASDPRCQTVRRLAAIPCTRRDTCRPFEEYERMVGESGFVPAPLPTPQEPTTPQD